LFVSKCFQKVCENECQQFLPGEFRCMDLADNVILQMDKQLHGVLTFKLQFLWKNWRRI